MLCLNPFYLGKKYFKGYHSLTNDNLFTVTTLGVRCVFKIKNNLLSKLKFNFLRNTLYQLPSYIINLLVDYDVKIVLIDESEMFDLIGENKVLGLYKNNGLEQTIYINNNQSFFTLTNALFHEIGHFIDKCIGDKKDKNSLNSIDDIEFKNLLMRELNSLNVFYYQLNPSELFAQIFSELMQENKEVLYQAPLSCRYIYSQLKLIT